jgi:hypothetical protein
VRDRSARSHRTSIPAIEHSIAAIINTGGYPNRRNNNPDATAAIACALEATRKFKAETPLRSDSGTQSIR